ncbi:hypothetical protein BCR44DRAFT_1514728 [Catenaria anguillulae PL171]|uniref:Uncharacterized protein n=1 Tax=Catenaria anguillulae PL171 TaxID=765915 RepID=A0A1Y2HH62_9FUNG|nr:hypothetical protein BCR44DRAFT_1514728 [Catenaria anguillulae PL171]
MLSHLLSIISLLLVASSVATAAPAASASSPADCKSYVDLYGRDLVNAFDDGAAFTDLRVERSYVANQGQCIQWAQSKGYYVAVLARTDRRAPPGHVRCYAKNVPKAPEFKGDMLAILKRPWNINEPVSQPQYLGQYDIPGYDIATANGDLAPCDAYVTVDGKTFCKKFNEVDHSILLLSKDCPKL